LRSRLPVLRTARRYVAFAVDAEEEIEAKDLIHEIRSSQASLFGDAGAARNRLKLISFQGGLGLLRCHGAYIQEPRAALAAIYSINGIRAACHIKGVAGTIKSATEKYIPKLGKISSENDGRRIELEEISGCIVHTHGLEIDLCPDERNWTKGSDTRYLGLTSFDLCGGHDDADGTSDGL
jgi:ribonuclease P/MRP protein subunit POP5